MWRVRNEPICQLFDPKLELGILRRSLQATNDQFTPTERLPMTKSRTIALSVLLAVSSFAAIALASTHYEHGTADSFWQKGQGAACVEAKNRANYEASCKQGFKEGVTTSPCGPCEQGEGNWAGYTRCLMDYTVECRLPD
jgi:hypothetical protein